MADKVIEHHEHGDNSSGMLMGLALVVIIVLLFMIFGGINMFRGASTEPQTEQPAEVEQTETGGAEGGSIDVDFPEQIDINTNGEGTDSSE